MSLYKRLVEDVKNNNNFKGRIIVVSNTVLSFFRSKVNNKFTLLLCAPIIVMYKFVTDLVLGCEIPASTKIGRGLVIHHGRGIVLNSNVVIGDNVTLNHNTTIGNKKDIFGMNMGSPVIGDNVVIGPNTVIIGPVKIGANSIVGAGSVVVKNVKKNTVVAGNPARFIKNNHAKYTKSM